MSPRGRQYTRYDDVFSEESRKPPKPEYKHFADNLNSAIKATGIAPQDLAKAIHKPTSSVSYYRNGQQFPKPATLILLAEALNTSVDALLGHVREQETAFTNDYPSLGLLFGLSAESVSKLIALSDSCSATLDRIIRSDLFDKAIARLNEAELFIAKRFMDIRNRCEQTTIKAKDKATGETVELPINEKGRKANLYASEEESKYASLEILAVLEELKPLLREALGYDDISAYLKGCASDGE